MTIPNIENRENIIQYLKEELVGPAPEGEPTDFDNTDIFKDYKPKVQINTGEEVLQITNPCSRYGAGVLYPQQSQIEEEEVLGSMAQGELEKWGDDDDYVAQKDINVQGQPGAEDIEETGNTRSESYFPSSMGLSFLISLRAEDTVVVDVTAGRYRIKDVVVKTDDGHGRPTQWWLRSPVDTTFTFSGSDLLGDTRELTSSMQDIEGIILDASILSRPFGDDQGRLLTVTITNRTPSAINGKRRDELCLFQSEFKMILRSENGFIKRYPKPEYAPNDVEELSIELLHRDHPTFAIGHGCSATWDKNASTGSLKEIAAEIIPTYEAPSITPVVTDSDGKEILVSMSELAGLRKESDGFDRLHAIVSMYRDWINKTEQEISSNIPEDLREAAMTNIVQCRECLSRMENGLDVLNSNPKIKEAFRLANHAMLLQQIASSQPSRKLEWDEGFQRIYFPSVFRRPNTTSLPSNRGYWRPFQIAFILMTLASTADSSSPERDTVELIWFPTGGGKTEAYLGLSAFSIFLRRLRNPTNIGTEVITRYTLRLLTSQQFQRTAAMTTAMEFIRRGRKDLGVKPIKIGIWVGGGLTPNRSEDAQSALTQLRNTPGAENPFVLLECPWCKASMGPKDWKGYRPVGANTVYGYEPSEKTVVFNCPDSSCDFRDGIPILVVDEDIYKTPPDFLIATVDKFALLAWREDSRSLFGIDSLGERLH